MKLDQIEKDYRIIKRIRDREEYHKENIDLLENYINAYLQGEENESAIGYLKFGMYEVATWELLYYGFR